MEVHYAARRVLGTSRLAAHDGELVFRHRIEVFPGCIFSDDCIGCDHVLIVWLQAAHDDGIEKESGAQFLFKGCRRFFRSNVIGSLVCHVVVGDIHGEGFSVTHNIEGLGANDGNHAIDAQHLRLLHKDESAKCGGIFLQSRVGVVFGGLNVDPELHGVERGPTFVQLRNQLVVVNGLGKRGRFGHGEFARGGQDGTAR